MGHSAVVVRIQAGIHAFLPEALDTVMCAQDRDIGNQRRMPGGEAAALKADHAEPGSPDLNRRTV